MSPTTQNTSHLVQVLELERPKPLSKQSDRKILRKQWSMIIRFFFYSRFQECYIAWDADLPPLFKLIFYITQHVENHGAALHKQPKQ